MSSSEEDEDSRPEGKNSPRPSKKTEAVPILMASRIIGNERMDDDDDEPRKSIQFADEIGSNLAENHFVKTMHYSTDMSRNSPPIQDCCTIW